MSRYVITITPDTYGATGTAQTTMRVDMSTGQTRITELTVQAANGQGLAPADVPPIDLDLLVRALTARTPRQALPVAAPAERAAESPTVEPAASPRRRPRKTVSKTAKKAAPKTTRSKAARGKATKASKATAHAAGTRAYRRMPDPEQVMDVYNQTGSITAVAEHFDVPRHTVAGWARRLRTMGHAIGRQ